MEGGRQTLLMLMSSSGFHVLAAASAAGFTFKPPYSLTGNSTAPPSLRTTVFGGSCLTRSLSGLAPRPGPQYPDRSGTFCCAVPVVCCAVPVVCWAGADAVARSTATDTTDR